VAWRFHGRAHVNPSAPRAWAICDDCGFLYDHSALRWKLIWAGPILQNKRVLVCPTCWDVPNPQLKPRILPPDPMPILNARPPNYIEADDDFRVTEEGGIRVDEDDVPRVTENVANNREDAP
jgi:hypothetical protein